MNLEEMWKTCKKYEMGTKYKEFQKIFSSRLLIYIPVLLRASAIDSNFRVSERTDYRKIRPVADNECKNENGNPRNKNG